MTNDDMLRNIEYLREKADVSYEEAASLLERYDGNVMRVLVELERQGRILGQTPAGQEKPQAQPKAEKSDVAGKAASFINKAFEHHIVVEKGTGENKKTIANLSAPFCIGATVVAPHLAIASAALTFISGYRVRLKREKGDPVVPEDVDAFVDKTVSNIKTTASSITQTVRDEWEAQNGGQADHDDDEGGEITIE